jgi:hypothetical protein
MITKNDSDFSGLKALFFNGTLTKSPGVSHTDKLIAISQAIMDKQGVKNRSLARHDCSWLA